MSAKSKRGKGQRDPSNAPSILVDSASKRISGSFAKYLPLLLSGLSLCVAVLALYYSQLAPPRLDYSWGRTLEFYHPQDGGFGMYIPVTVVNTANNSGTVRQIAAVLQHVDDNHSYFFDWVAFGTPDPVTRDWKDEVIAHPLVVAPEAAIHKTLLFLWRPETRPEIAMKEGVYQLDLYAKSNVNREFQRVAAVTFTMSSESVRILNERRARRDPQTRTIAVRGPLGENEVLTDAELRHRLRND